MAPNAEFMKQHFFKEGRLTEKQALYILSMATAILSREPNLVNVGSPVTSEFASLLCRHRASDRSRAMLGSS